MKKLLLGAITALAFLFGFASCSGDLHDMEDPNKMEGNWFYYELDTSAAKGNINIIFSDGGDCQTKDISGVKKTGSVYYLWAAATKNDVVVESLRSDNPDKGFSEDKLGVYVFTNASKCMLWAWEDKINFTGGNWPGVAMQSDTAAAIATATISVSVKATGVRADTTYWFSGLSWDAGWPYRDWNGDPAFASDENHAKYRATADGNGIVEWRGPFTKEVDTDTATTIEFKFIDIVNDSLDSGGPTFNPDNIQVEIPTISSDTSFNIIITCKEGDKGLYVENSKVEFAN